MVLLVGIFTFSKKVYFMSLMVVLDFESYNIAMKCHWLDILETLELVSQSYWWHS